MKGKIGFIRFLHFNRFLPISLSNSNRMFKQMFHLPSRFCAMLSLCLRNCAKPPFGMESLCYALFFVFSLCSLCLCGENLLHLLRHVRNSRRGGSLPYTRRTFANTVALLVLPAGFSPTKFSTWRRYPCSPPATTATISPTPPTLMQIVIFNNSKNEICLYF
jgi:hypothetical protein